MPDSHLIQEKFSQMDILVLMTSAICHDLDHPGYNNTYVWDFFLVSTLKSAPSLRGNIAYPSTALRRSCQPRSLTLQDAVPNFWTLYRVPGLPWKGTSKATKKHREPQFLKVHGSTSLLPPREGGKWDPTPFSARMLPLQATAKGIGREPGLE